MGLQQYLECMYSSLQMIIYIVNTVSTLKKALINAH
jgi:hypothetical protein